MRAACFRWAPQSLTSESLVDPHAMCSMTVTIDKSVKQSLISVAGMCKISLMHSFKYRVQRPQVGGIIFTKCWDWLMDLFNLYVPYAWLAWFLTASFRTATSSCIRLSNILDQKLLPLPSPFLIPSLNLDVLYTRKIDVFKWEIQIDSTVSVLLSKW